MFYTVYYIFGFIYGLIHTFLFYIHVSLVYGDVCSHLEKFPFEIGILELDKLVEEVTKDL